MRSDNGTNFVGAEKDMREALTSLYHNQIQGDLIQNGGTRHGPVWKRVIRMVRKVFSSVLQLQTIDDPKFCVKLSPY